MERLGGWFTDGLAVMQQLAATQASPFGGNGQLSAQRDPRSAFGKFGSDPGRGFASPFGTSALAPRRGGVASFGDAFGEFGLGQRSGFGVGAFGTGEGNQIYGLGLRTVRQAGEDLGRGLNQLLGGAFDPGMGGSVGAPFTPTGGRFAGGNLDSAANYINAAAAKWGVPANFLAAIIAHESSGNWSRDGGRYVYLPDRGHYILPYVGMTDPAVRQFGVDPRSLIGNQAGQIDLLARQLRRLYDQYGSQGGWRAVSNVHYSGDPTGGYTPGDSWQYGSTAQYTNNIMSWWGMLEPGFNPNAAPGSAPSMGGGTIGDISAVWGGKQFSISQDFGPTDFSMGQGAWMYDYGAGLGVQGHPGLDIAMPYGTPIYSATGGTVVRAGGTGYYVDEGGGVGEIRVKLDNGDEVIYGHMGTSRVRVGDRVQPGMLIGTSGTANGAHLHLEYRRFGANTSTGYQAVDPRQALGGGFIPGGTGSTPGGMNALSQPQRFGARWWDVPFSQLQQLAAR